MSNLSMEELDELKGLLNQELLLVKKFKCYASASKDPQLKQKCEQVASQHQDHFLRLLNQLG